MNVSPSSSATLLINNAQRKSSDAAQTIATLPIHKNEIGSSEFNSSDVIKPILNLKEAELETSVAAKLIAADKKMLGSILDIHA
ncbi:MAG: hypothetical protein Q8N35_04580 [Methylococcaceae bacterium]|jgi:hypothetical protein|nr:hypothetical protein [Methylococcaceae bacterium]MDZ4155729.1 hypothetical protein [Methylococcales bacterium]MDP2391922.1 hypothetical protein [Methylococcaceae bacterium]MDP3018839.1 hypothetical protein [Methylococcaceae bacterium]MDP3391400.1 hypothetical protein [Methylococcaceae bacterium]